MQKSKVNNKTSFCIACHNNTNMTLTKLKTTDDHKMIGESTTWKCCECKMMYSDLYNNENTNSYLNLDNNSSLNKFDVIILNFFLRLRIKKISKILNTTIAPSNMKILDVGGGSGNFARLMNQLNYSTQMIEPNISQQYHKSNVITDDFSSNLIYNKTMEPGSFDLITFWHSLEHFSNPVDALSTAYVLLKKGGIVFICVPNIESLQSLIGKQLWTYLDIPLHKFHFTKKSLILLANNSQFSDPSFFRFSLEYELFGFLQTLMNITSRSYNVLYHQRKKGIRKRHGMFHNYYINFINLLWPIFLIPSILLSFIAFITNKSSCIELYAKKL